MTSIPFETRCVNSLRKVFADEEWTAPAYERGTALRNEAFAFQVAYRAPWLHRGIRVETDSLLKEQIEVRAVGLAPSDFPARDNHDGDILRTAPGLYPDPLLPIDPREGIHAPPNQWRAVWVTIDPGDGLLPAGVHPIRLRFVSEEEELLGEAEFTLDVVPALLPKQRLLHYEWLHFDCLATYYGVPIFGERHWELLENYVRAAVRYGINTFLTPIVTPPLDTKVGGERPTVQLVDIALRGDQYAFGFDKLKRWVDLCNRCGVSHFEFSHLFTQWGAKHAPKIVATVDGEERRIFGWETDATGPAYRAFLDQFLPALDGFVRTHGLERRAIFHVSDEPEPQDFEAYRQAKEIIAKHLKGYPIMDALSDYRFYESGLVERPIPASDHIGPFLANGVPGLWTYYCNAQQDKVANRMFSMPSSRGRVIGLQLYKFGMEGFAHWGYNFWYTRYATKAIDPYRVTDAGMGFPSGDSHLVYPGDDGHPVGSIRLEVLREALQDLRALELFEMYAGKEAAIALLEEGLTEPITFADYPRGDAWLLAFRARLNEAIRQHATASEVVDNGR
ncbi:DUF4091 domain-containing protein [Cohnella sp. REN36]|uniref:DUF4091 domain-containing protein n=1 Tax=Cohnella sp. REN36 TaxID=2887347 RepID=UPI001D14AC48|nr:DUF4091 domain-containing protein [Cohnella sp. REN36]MCC3376034.1 DUF4091 domain-containing protein [Cohnella sp. REN36]